MKYHTINTFFQPILKLKSGETLQLSELGIDPKQVVFELTEKSAVTDFRQFEKVLSNYCSQGFRIAIDDVIWGNQLN